MLHIIFTIIFGKKAGIDIFGNRYYYSNSKLLAKERRWVVFKGLSDPSKIPDAWESWLRFQSSTPLPTTNFFWQKYRIPNLTGTKFAFMFKSSNKHKNSYNSYEPWNK